jgi:hypothetical protein
MPLPIRLGTAQRLGLRQPPRWRPGDVVTVEEVRRHAAVPAPWMRWNGAKTGCPCAYCTPTRCPKHLDYYLPDCRECAAPARPVSRARAMTYPHTGQPCLCGSCVL